METGLVKAIASDELRSRRGNRGYSVVITTLQARWFHTYSLWIITNSTDCVGDVYQYQLAYNIHFFFRPQVRVRCESEERACPHGFVREREQLYFVISPGYSAIHCICCHLPHGEGHTHRHTLPRAWLWSQCDPPAPAHHTLSQNICTQHGWRPVEKSWGMPVANFTSLVHCLDLLAISAGPWNQIGILPN